MNKYKKKYRNKLVDFLFVLSCLPALAYYLKFYNIVGALVIYFACIAFVVAVLKYIAYSKNRKLLNCGIDKVDNMPGEYFEEFLLQHFKKLGYSGYVTRGSADYGADLVLNKDGIRIIVQAKRWKQKVGIDAVQQVTAALKHYNAQQAIVATNSYFTANAVQLANSNNVLLWDRDKIISIMIENKDNTPPDDTHDDVCPECGKKLVQRRGKRGLFIGCTGFPACRYTKDL